MNHINISHDVNGFLWDTHMHSSFSGDCEAPPEDMILGATGKGLAGICFTEHIDIDYPEDKELFELDIDAYAESLLKLSQKYPTKDIRFGVELGLQPHLVGRYAEITKKYPFDFVIGSSHVVNGWDPYNPASFEGHDEKERYREYFVSILENVKLFDDYDVYGHIDYVVRYGPTKNENYTWTEYQDIIDDVLRTLIEKGKGIEINTGGFKYGLGHPNPTEGILRRYKELGGEIITTGSDAHRPEHIAYDFEKVPSILKDAGFKYYTVFTKRKPQFIKLP